MQKYLRYIFNGHLVFVMVLALGGWAYYYSDWVKTVKNDFPAALIMAFILSIIVTRSPINTFLREPDIVFILPLETKLKSYFKSSFILSWIIQGCILACTCSSIPMYAKVTGANFNNFISVLVLVLIMKFFNLYISWYVLKYQEVSASRVDLLIRFLINGALMYLVIDEAMIVLSGLTLLLLLGLFLYYRIATRQKILKWDRLVALERKASLVILSNC